MAVANKVQVVGMSSLAAGHKTLAPQLVEALKAKGANDVIVVVGGVIPRQDYDFLLEHGVSAVFGPAPMSWMPHAPCLTCWKVACETVERRPLGEEHGDLRLHRHRRRHRRLPAG